MGISSVGIAIQQSYNLCSDSSMGGSCPLSFDPLPTKRGPSELKTRAVLAHTHQPTCGPPLPPGIGWRGP